MRTPGAVATYFDDVRPDTAILLFSRTAAAEARAKAFGPRGGRVAAALLGRTERTLARTGLPLYRSSEQEQRGTDFGSKLALAVAGVLTRGYHKVIIVGNDCPTLSVGAVRHARQALESGRPVIGPDARGGVWLLGLRREDIATLALSALPWQTPTLAITLLDRLPGAQRLGVRRDYNRLAELLAHASHLRPRLSDLMVLLLEGTTPATGSRLLACRAVRTLPALRGPPRG